MSNYYEHFAAAYVCGMCPELAFQMPHTVLLDKGRTLGLKLHRFKKTAMLPRVRAVIGILRNLMPTTLADIGSGRGVFLWPLLDVFPHLQVTAIERDERRLAHLEAVRRGGIENLHTIHADAAQLPLPDHAFNITTALEVLEHQHDRFCLRVRLCVLRHALSSPQFRPKRMITLSMSSFLRAKALALFFLRQERRA